MTTHSALGTVSGYITGTLVHSIILEGVTCTAATINRYYSSGIEGFEEKLPVMFNFLAMTLSVLSGPSNQLKNYIADRVATGVDILIGFDTEIDNQDNTLIGEAETEILTHF